MAKKAAELLPQIINATTDEEAIVVLQNTLKLLHMSTDYTDLVELRDKMKEFEAEYRTLTDELRAMPFPRSYEALSELRENLAFLQRDTVDALSFQVNYSKIFLGDEKRTQVRAESIIEAASNEELITANNKKKLSLSALEKVYGISDTYQSYLNLAAFAYGNYQALIALLANMNKMLDSLASQAAHALQVLARDAK